AAVNKLREALGDAADSPRFIQTIPRRGYRFIAPVEPAENQSRVSFMATRGDADLPPQEGAVAKALESRAFLSEAQELPAIPHRYSRVLFGLLQTMYLSFYALAMANLRGVDAALRALGVPPWIFVLTIVTACVGISV